MIAGRLALKVLYSDHLSKSKLLITLKSLVELIAPHECMLCSREGTLLCEPCASRAVVAKRPTCFRCNRLSEGGRTCKRCRSYTKLTGVTVASHYDGAIKELIRRMKYGRVEAAAEPLAKLLTPLLMDGKFEVVTAVPTAPSRRRERGYNQAELIARAVARELSLPYLPLLGRFGKSSQVGLNRAERLDHIRGTIYALPGRQMTRRRVLIVDDVLTTGATMSECAVVLKQAGAARVWGGVIAKH